MGRGYRIPIPEGCVIGLSHLECSEEGFEALRASLGVDSRAAAVERELLERAREACEKTRAEIEALRELAQLLLPKLSEVDREARELEEVARAFEDAPRLVEEARRLLKELTSIAAALERHVGAWLCWAVTPHEAPNSSSRDRIPRGLVKTAREAFAAAVEGLPGVKLSGKGFVYLFLRASDASRFLLYYTSIVEPVRRRLERLGVQTISDAKCQKVLIAAEDAVRLLGSELERLRSTAAALEAKLREKRREGRIDHIQRRLREVKRKLQLLERVAREIRASLGRGSVNTTALTP